MKLYMSAGKKASRPGGMVPYCLAYAPLRIYRMSLSCANNVIATFLKMNAFDDYYCVYQYKEVGFVKLIILWMYQCMCIV